MNELQSLELKIAKFLRWGVVFSGVVLLIGWIMQFKLSGDPFFTFQTYDQIPFLDLLKHHIQHRNWSHLISYAGLLMLISLPLIRVLLTAFLFIKQKDFILALIALVVFLGLVSSMFLGIEL